MDIVKLKTMNIIELGKLAQKLNIPDYGSLRKQELIFFVIENIPRIPDLC